MVASASATVFLPGVAFPWYRAIWSWVPVEPLLPVAQPLFLCVEVLGLGGQTPALAPSEVSLTSPPEGNSSQRSKGLKRLIFRRDDVPLA